MTAAHQTRARAGAAVLTVLGVLLPSLAAGAAGPGPQRVLVFDGRGHGHGVGLAQESAFAMAVAGSSDEQILDHFYPGTARSSRSGTVRVDVWEGGAATAVDVSLPRGGRVTGSHGSMQAPAGTTLHVAYDGAGYHVRQTSTAGEPGVSGRAMWPVQPLLATASPTPAGLPLPLPSARPSSAPAATPARSAAVASTAPSAGTRPAASAGGSAQAKPQVAASPSSATRGMALDSTGPINITPAAGSTAVVGPTGRSYRGTLVALSRLGFRLINWIDVEDYLHGLGEVPASWPTAALRAQAVAARTYALRAAGGPAPLGYDLCDDDRCQVYLGAQRETARSTAATEATRGEVITYRGAIAAAFYSANAGGRTASAAEGFGSANTSPYLQAGIAAPGTVDTWTQSADPAAVAARLHYPGRLTAVTVTARGPSGRVTQLQLQGTAGAVQLTGVEAAQRLGLWSTLFTVHLGTGVAQALPAPRAALTQLAPELASDAPPRTSAAEPPTAGRSSPDRSNAGGHRRAAAAAGGLALALLLTAAGLTAYDNRRAQRAAER